METKDAAEISVNWCHRVGLEVAVAGVQSNWTLNGKLAKLKRYRVLRHRGNWYSVLSRVRNADGMSNKNFILQTRQVESSQQTNLILRILNYDINLTKCVCVCPNVEMVFDWT